MHPKCDSIRVQTHDFQIVNSIFHVLAMLVSTTEPSMTSACHILLLSVMIVFQFLPAVSSHEVLCL